MTAIDNTKSPMVIGVVVTHHRREELKRSLDILTTQSRPLDHLIIVDNANESEVRELLQSDSADSSSSVSVPSSVAAPSTVAATSSSAAVPSSAPTTTSYTADLSAISKYPSSQPNCRSLVPVTYLASRHNLGGAGGFALGMLYALSLGADWVWCADDDGHPDGPDVLSTLLACAKKHELEEVSPLVCDIDNPTLLAFPVRQGLVWRRKRSEIEIDSPGNDLLPRYSSLMNGALFSANCLDRIGVPDLRLFIRGDEVEMHRRLQRSGLRFGTCLTTAYLHPNGSDEFKPIIGGRMFTQYPDSPTKRFFTYRNRGYLMSQAGMRRLLLQEYARFTWFFIIQRRDLRGFLEWRKLRKMGRQEHFPRPD